MSSNNVLAIKTLVERESYWLQEKIKDFSGKKAIIFPAGISAQAFCTKLQEDYGINADFFIDNNPTVIGSCVCGKPVKSINDIDGINLDDYVIFIPTASKKIYLEISAQLDSLGSMYYINADAYQACQLFDRYNKVAKQLADNKSKLAFWGAIYALLTCDYSFIQQEGNMYFALREFCYIGSETVLDIGAYVGDTLEEYIKRAPEGAKIYAFEPLASAREKLEARVLRLKSEWLFNSDDIIVEAAGVGEKTGTLSFTPVANTNMLKPDEKGSMEVPLYSIDDYFKDKPPFTLLKADIEGAEMQLLKGAENMIKKHKPKMTLCIYHSPLDFCQIAEYVSSLVPEYRMYVRNHCYDHRETILYCVI